MSKNQEFAIKAKLAEQQDRLSQNKKNVVEAQKLKPVDPKGVVTEEFVIDSLIKINGGEKVGEINLTVGMNEDELFYAINSMLEKAGCSYSLFVDTGCGSIGIASAVNELIKNQDKFKKELKDGNGKEAGSSSK